MTDYSLYMMPVNETVRETGLAPLIAIVGSDGSGKSTVGAALLVWMRESRPTELCHLGKQTGNIGRAIARLPFVGGKLDKTIAGKSGRARDDDGPGGVTAVVIFLFSMRRVLRFRRMLTIRRRGVAVLADRFPQTEVPGPMDGPGLYAPAPRSVIARVLGRHERRLYVWMAGYRPDLVLRLNVDLATAMARKPDHRPSSLRYKVEAVPLLSFNGAPIVDLDSTEPLAEVLAKAKQAITATLAKR